jgi:penicillin-binding protein 1A
MRAAHQGVAVANLPGGDTRSGGGLFSGLFGDNGSPAPRPAATVGAAPAPPAPVQSASSAPPAHDGASLDGYLLQNLFGRR